MDIRAMFKLSYGLFVLTARDGDKDNGCIINTAAQVTTTPNRITIAVNKQNYTHDMIVKTGVVNISILDETAPFTLFQDFGFRSGRDCNKFEGAEPKRAENGVAYIDNFTCAYISGKVISTVDLGTHTLFVADVTGAELISENEPVTYAYYHKNIKPAPQPVEKKEEKVAYRCRICGYVHEGELPDDFICPICKHGASDFERI